MHRFIMSQNSPLTRDMIIDHINNDKIDNRRENLRIVSRRLNSHNKKKPKNAKSKYYGVKVCDGKFTSGIDYDYKHYHVGTFDTELDAAKAYDMHVVHSEVKLLHNLNFPENRDEYLKMEYKCHNKWRNQKSKFYGVTKWKDRYTCRIRWNKKNKQVYIGKNEIAAAKAYDSFIVEHEMNKKLNFPDDHPEYVPIVIKPIKTKKVDVDDNTIKLCIRSSPESDVFIDLEDYDKVKHYSCNVSRGYVNIKTESKKTGLHRFLLNVYDPNVHVDHIDNNPLNNCKSNLRLATSSQNSANRKKKTNKSSKYIGVHKTPDNTWKGKVMCQYKEYGKIFKKEEHAARFRDLVVLEFFKSKHHKLNFIWTQEDREFWKKEIKFEDIF